jgi:sarcosine oxidase subunit gamma
MAEPSVAMPIPGAEPVTRAGVAFSVLPHHARITVRGRDHDAALAQAVARVLGTAPPAEPNTVTRAGARTALWLAPGSWRIVGAPDEDSQPLTAALREAVPRARAGVVDTSDFYATIRIHGSGARATLARGCPLDLHPRAFGAGRCARSLLARTDVLLLRVDDAPTYDIEVRRSLAPYLWSWLTGAPIRPDGLLADGLLGASGGVL